MLDDTTPAPADERGLGGGARPAPLAFRVIVVIIVFQFLRSVVEVFFGSDPFRDIEAGVGMPPGVATGPGGGDAYATGMVRAVAGVVFYFVAALTLVGRLRWPTNLALTAWAGFASAMSVSASGYALALIAWVLLLAPRTQLFLRGVDVFAPRTHTATRANAAAVAVLSALLPGLGQFVQRRWLRGLALALSLAWAAAAVFHLQPVWTLLVLFAASDAYWWGRSPVAEDELRGDFVEVDQPTS